MELWLLGAGALVLVGITLWIVWPARGADPVGTSSGSTEVSETLMTETVTPSGLPPQGDRFEDQYTSATADLSAGAVAAATAGLQETPTTPPPFPAGTYGAAPYTPAATAAPYPQPETSTSLMPRRTMGLGAGAVFALSGGIGGAWLYARWQRERNKPINRLRRTAREVASRLGERMPDVDELPHGAAPMSGAATALLLTALVAGRALRHESDDDTTQELRSRASEVLRQSLDEARGRGRDAVKQGRKQSRQIQSRLPADRLASVDETRKPAVMGIGLGGMAVVAGAAFAVWRLVRRGKSDRSTWYAGE